MIKLTNSIRLAILGAAMTTGMASAQEQSGFTISPMLGFYGFDGELEWEDSISGSIALGYRSAGPLGLELVYMMASTETELSAIDLDQEQVRLDLLYHLGRSGPVEPYLVAGVGLQRLSPDGWEDYDNTVATLGFGINYFLTEGLSVRSDFRVFNDVDYESTDYGFGLGLRYLFGAQKAAPAVEEPRVTTPADSDKDGVPDSTDRCPGTARGTSVDDNGCKIILDEDGDGVADERDACPDTSAGASVDAQGCYEVITETREVTMRVEFANNSAEVSPNSISEIKKAADFMTKYPLTQAVIEGHSDDRGAADYNQKLSEQRAASVALVLVREFGIDKSRVSSVGYGESRPLVENNSEANRAANRRVTAKISAQVKSVQK